MICVAMSASDELLDHPEYREKGEDIRVNFFYLFDMETYIVELLRALREDERYMKQLGKVPVTIHQHQGFLRHIVSFSRNSGENSLVS